MISDAELDSIEQRAAKATSGPWRNDKDTIWADGVGGDIKSICETREDVPHLVAEIYRLRAENTKLRAIIEPILSLLSEERYEKPTMFSVYFLLLDRLREAGYAVV